MEDVFLASQKEGELKLEELAKLRMPETFWIFIPENEAWYNMEHLPRFRDASGRELAAIQHLLGKSPEAFLYETRSSRSEGNFLKRVPLVTQTQKLIYSYCTAVENALPSEIDVASYAQDVKRNNQIVLSFGIISQYGTVITDIFDVSDEMPEKFHFAFMSDDVKQILFESAYAKREKREAVMKIADALSKNLDGVLEITYRNHTDTPIKPLDLFYNKFAKN